MRSTFFVIVATFMNCSTSFAFEGDRTSMLVCCQHATSDVYAPYSRPHLQSHFARPPTSSIGERRYFTNYNNGRYYPRRPYERY
jgi:hypothetical protein